MAFRKGQWVKLVKPMTFGKQKEDGGVVGIYVGTATERAPDGTIAPVLGHAEVHLVDVPEGTTRLKVAVPDEALVAVTDKNEIPADRLAGMRDGWEPVA